MAGMNTDLEKKREQTQTLIKQGLYDQAVIICGQTLEHLYRWLYKELQPRLKPQEQQSVSKNIEKHGKAVGDLTIFEEGSNVARPAQPRHASAR